MSRVLGLITNVLNWWVSTFTKQNLVGKIIFGSVSLCIVCFLCGLPARIIAPSPTPQAPVSDLTESDAPTAPTEAPAATEAAPTEAPTSQAEAPAATEAAPTEDPTATVELPTATPEPPTATATPTEIPATDTPAPTPTPEIVGLVKAGTHLVGTDIEPGIYVGFAGESLLGSCYWARLSNLTGSDDLLANDNAVGQYYIEVLSNDVALETDCDLFPIDQVPARNEFLTTLPAGTYLIGRDIGAGIYRGEVGEDILESCYWERSSNVNGDSGSILANDNANGQFFIEVLPTDFALKVGCEVVKAQ